MTKPNPTLCPECLAGKHRNCDGGSWDFMSDQPTRCACGDSSHEVRANAERTDDERIRLDKLRDDRR